mmetsp:Transcript_33008/g.60501  ORF Transcript_33008/g.60501 Transcript_33008/m.60501 type:complete len:220 (+) Transcript_33008:152-811(+)
MLLPGQAVLTRAGPPTAYALRMRPWLMVAMSFLIPVAVARFVVVDLVGSVSLLLTAVAGMYAVSGNMDVMWLLCIAIVLILNGVFDACLLCLRMVKSKVPLLGAFLPWYWNLVHAVLIAGPLVEILGGALCWCIYRDHVAHMSSAEALYESRSSWYGAMQIPSASQMPAETSSTFVPGHHWTSDAPSCPTSSSRTTFTAFEGERHRLSSEDYPESKSGE